MRKIICTFGFLAFYVATYAQDIASAIVMMPDEMLLGVTVDQKKQLAVNKPDSIEEKVFVMNVFGDSIIREAYTDDYVSLKTSEAGKVEIKFLPLVNNSNIIAVITTVCGQICDSRIDFYTTSWQPLDKTVLFSAIDLDSFIKNDSDKNSLAFKNALAGVDMLPVKYAFSDGGEIVVEAELDKYLSLDDYKAIQPYLNPNPLIFEWDKFAYKLK